MKTEKLRRAKLSADTLFAGRATSSNPPIWREGRLQKGSDKALDMRRLKAAADEVKLLELIANYPGNTSGWYALRIKRLSAWVLTTLHTYKKDGIVRTDGFPYRWYLHE